MRLNRLPPRRPATIRLVHSADDVVAARRMHEMGFDTGVEVEVLHAAPLGGDPIAVRVGGATVAMRRAQAELIELDWREAAE